jgi:hypothetical protein
MGTSWSRDTLGFQQCRPRRMWLFSNSLPCLFHPISSNAIFINIDPRGKEFAMNIPQALCIGNAVARGHHLRVPLCCQNCKLSTPSGEKPPTEHQKLCNNDKSFIVISRSDLMQPVRMHVHVQRPPQHVCCLRLCGRGSLVATEVSSCHFDKKDKNCQFCSLSPL